MNQKVSIIMPVYNVEDYLEASVRSVIDQTYTNFELILVDDGSTDRSAALADELAKTDKRITVIHKKNGGLSDARDAGIKIVKGDFIIFFDSDDLWEPNALEVLVYQQKKTKADIIVFGYFVDYHDKSGRLYKQATVSEPDKTIMVGGGKKYTLETLSTIGYAWNKLYKASLILESDIRFEEGTSYIEDILFNSQMFSLCHKVQFINTPLYHYIQRPRTTLGTTYPENGAELDRRASRAFRSIVKTLEIKDKESISRRNVMNRARWTSGLIANSNIQYKKKMQYIGEVVEWVRDEKIALRDMSDGISSLYFILFKMNARSLILCTELCKKKLQIIIQKQRMAKI